MRRHLTVLRAAAGVLAAGALSTTPLMAQVVVDDVESADAPAVVMVYAEDALAQVNDTSDARIAQRKVDLYKQLMELNGTSRNIRRIIQDNKESVRLVIMDRAKTDRLSVMQEHKYNQISSGILKEAEVNVINLVAVAQAKAFSEEEISLLIKANGSAAGIRYNAGKFMTSEAYSEQIQTYMVEAVVKIIKTFTEQVTG